jgi:hypothetical protein
MSYLMSKQQWERGIEISFELVEPPANLHRQLGSIADIRTAAKC